MIDSMMLELDTRKNYLNNEIIHSIYFGGGTPSIINSKYIIKIISKIKSLFIINPDAEITMEFNPDDLDKDKLIEIKSAGINRLSIGIQSFHDNDLTFMNRSHDAKAKNSLSRNISPLKNKGITKQLISHQPSGLQVV